MSELSEFLPVPSENQNAFILDHGKTENGELKYADDFTSYGWSTKRYNKLTVGAFVLNRRPGKLNKDRKFEIYGGGYVESISEPDDDGNVKAVISHPFKIEPPIKQGDSFIENFEWETKTKKKNSWEHFWNQYGMNEISYKEFINLIDNQHLVPINEQYENIDEDITLDEIKQLEDNFAGGFNATFDANGPTHQDVQRKRSFVAKKIDFDRVNESKKRVGSLGEEIVFDLLKQQAYDNGNPVPIHASKDEGDGLGYDIRMWDKEGNEIQIEVKASSKKYSDGFEMTKNEVLASIEQGKNYKVYYVYDIDVETKRCNIKIYDGPFVKANYKLVPNTFKVFEK